MKKIQRFIFVSACLVLAVMDMACSSPRPRVNHTFSPAMAQNFEIVIENPADAAYAEQLGKIEACMISGMTEDFACQGLTGRVLSSLSEHTPAPNKKLLLVKLVDLKLGFTSTLSIDVTLKDGSTILTSWKDAVRTGRSWETLVRALNTRLAVKLRRYYAPTVPAPVQAGVQTSTGDAATAPTPGALPVPIETVDPF